MRKLLTCLVVLVATTAANAGPLSFFGQDNNANGSLPVPNSVAAQTSFLSNLTGVSVQTFESFATGTSLSGSGISVNFGPDTATLSGQASIAGSPGPGTFAISGTKFVQTTANGDLTLTFTSPQAAFGFFATDIGDVNSRLQLVFLNGVTTLATVNVPHALPAISGTGLFFGYIDVDLPFTSVRLVNTGTGGDVFGFDNFTIGRQSQVAPIPEPATLAVFGGIALAGALGYRRRKATASV